MKIQILSSWTAHLKDKSHKGLFQTTLKSIEGGLANCTGALKLAFLCLGRSPESETAIYKTDLLKQIVNLFKTKQNKTLVKPQ